MTKLWIRIVGFAVVGWLVVYSLAANAAEANDTIRISNLDTIWVIFTGAIVFFMNAGFAMLETGFCRNKNAVNILAKNLIVFSISTIAFITVGYAFMFGNGNEFWGALSLFLQNRAVFPYFTGKNIPLEAHLFFQITFAATSATIISGAVAERIKFLAFCIFTFLFIIFIYSIVGHSVWSETGLLSAWGFRDFAGSTVVHGVGGCAGLVGAWLLQPRIGKYRSNQKFRKDQKIRKTYFNKVTVPIRGHNLSLATLGCLILWLGWFGFNAGSTLQASANIIAHITLVTLVSGACGAISATLFAYFLYSRKPSISFMINGVLGGCVSITAPCAFVSVGFSAMIGIVGGILVVGSSIYVLDKLHIDDPVGAVPVHLVCGVWGTIAVGLFSEEAIYSTWEGLSSMMPRTEGIVIGGDGTLLAVQFVGVLVALSYTALVSLVIWSLIGYLWPKEALEKVGWENPRVRGLRVRLGRGNPVVRGLRVRPLSELKGLDDLFDEGLGERDESPN